MRQTLWLQTANQHLESSNENRQSAGFFVFKKYSNRPLPTSLPLRKKPLICRSAGMHSDCPTDLEYSVEPI